MVENGDRVDVPTFYFDRQRDTNDGKEWSKMDIADLKSSLADETSIEETAEFLCRRGSVEDVIKKATELGNHQSGGGRKRALAKSFGKGDGCRQK